MAVPILGKRRERRRAEDRAALVADVEKALSPAVALAAQAAAHSGATYPVNPSSPFTQTGGYGGAYAPLPRPDETFASLFGPGLPLVPDPLDALRPDGRADPRRYQYRVTTNVDLFDRQVPWRVLSDLASNCDVVSRCCLPGTEVVTQRGLIAIENVIVGDMVVTHRGRWRRVTDTLVNPAYQQAYQIDSSGFDPLRVTGNHPVWAARYANSRTNSQIFNEFAWIKAEDLRPKKRGKFDAMCLPVLDLSNQDDALTIAELNITRSKKGRPEVCPSTIPLNEAFGRIVGWYLAEGSVNTGTSLGPTVTTFSLADHEFDIAEQLAMDIKELFGYSSAIKANGQSHGIQLVVCGATLARMLSTGTARVKKVPAWAWAGGPDFMRAMLDGWASGDGYMFVPKNPNHSASMHVTTASKSLAWQMRLVALAAGFEPSLYHERGGRTTIIRGRPVTSNPDFWRVRWRLDAQRWGGFALQDDQLTAPIRSVVPIDYDGPVYNLEVEEDESYLTTGGTVHNCIELVQDALVGLDWSWGFSKSILNQIMQDQGITNTAKASEFARDKYGRELQRVIEFWEYPDKRMGQTFDTWISQFIWSTLTYDGIAVYPEFNLGGELTSLQQIDSSTIKILLDDQGFPPRPPAPCFQQILYGFPRGEFQAEDITADGKVPNGYARDQLAYYLHRPRPHTVYGFSAVEECINIATIYQARQQWLHSEYSHGVLPQLLIETAGAEIWSPEQLGFYQQILNDQLSGQIQRRQQALLLRPGMTASQLKQIEQTYQAAYDEMLVLQIGAKFGVPQSLLGIQMRSSIGGGSQTKGQSDQSEQFATDALRNFIIGCVNDLARRFLGVGPEITMTATGGGNDDDDLTRAQADASDVATGIRPRNEIRAERGLMLIDEPEADQLSITTGTGVQFLSGQLAQQQASAQITQNMAASGAVPGQQNEESGGAPSNSNNGGQQSSDSGTGQDQDEANGSAGSGKPGQSGTKPANNAKPAVQSNGDSNGGQAKPVGRPTNGKSSSNVKPKDDTRQPDADAEKELAAFARFAKTRQDKAWRDFEFTAVTPTQAALLNEAGRAGNLDAIKAAKTEATIDYSGRLVLPEPLQPGDRVVIEHREPVGKASAQESWAKQPIRKYQVAITEHYATVIATALKDSTKGLSSAITAAKKKFDAAKKAAGDSDLTPAQQAAAEAMSQVKMSPVQVQKVLEQLYGESYLTGSHAAAQQIGGGAKVTTGLESADAAIDWDSWVPGNPLAADIASNGGLQALLDKAGITIQSVQDNMMSQLENAIANGLSSGDSVDTIADSISDMVDGNADMIAVTESARAMADATISTYQDAGIDQFNWLAEDTACDECSDNADNGPYDVGDDPTVPQHPRCLCCTVPYIDPSWTGPDNADE